MHDHEEWTFLMCFSWIWFWTCSRFGQIVSAKIHVDPVTKVHDLSKWHYTGMLWGCPLLFDEFLSQHRNLRHPKALAFVPMPQHKLLQWLSKEWMVLHLTLQCLSLDSRFRFILASILTHDDGEDDDEDDDDDDGRWWRWWRFCSWPFIRFWCVVVGHLVLRFWYQAGKVPESYNQERWGAVPLTRGQTSQARSLGVLENFNLKTGTIQMQSPHKMCQHLP